MESEEQIPVGLPGLVALDPEVTFQSVVGMDAVKEQIAMKIIGPFKNPLIFKSFGKAAGGGILLFGPPGCGKTFIARATAGECEAKFIAVSAHDVLSKWIGESQQIIHEIFEGARRHAPAVLFFDEFDSLGASRGLSDSQFWRSMVTQFLEEMDGAQGRNEGVLIIAATNLPWNVDAAFRRPGRFDRVVFVPPPDESARSELLTRYLRALPGGDSVRVDELAKRTEFFSGADIQGLCERAAERAIARSLNAGSVQPVEYADLAGELPLVQPSTAEWFAHAKNYAEYANEGGYYNDLARFLESHKPRPSWGLKAPPQGIMVKVGASPRPIQAHQAILAAIAFVLGALVLGGIANLLTRGH